MGVKNLHSYFLTKCTKTSIQKTTMGAFEGKTIVIDISIYLYKFLGEDSFAEQLYLFLSLLRYYCVRAIFIFDGKPPPEKLALIRKRYQEKKKAEAKYDEIQLQIASMDTNESAYTIAVNELVELRKKMVRLRPEHVQQAKQLISAFGYAYYDAPGEADQLCAYFVQCGIAYACLSDDMDMFLLNCPRVLRNISMLNHSWTLYDTEQMLRELNMSLTTLIDIVILSGNDYTQNIITAKRPTLKRVLEIYQTEYCLQNQMCLWNATRFYDWFAIAHPEETTIVRDQVEQLCSMYDVKWMSELFEPIRTEHLATVNKMDIGEIKRLMEPHGFVFLQ